MLIFAIGCLPNICKKGLLQKKLVYGSLQINISFVIYIDTLMSHQDFGRVIGGGQRGVERPVMREVG